MTFPSGRHFLQIPGPTNVPDQILRAIAAPTMDHRGPQFQKLAIEVLAGIKTVFETKNPVIIYPASATGAWEAALVNTLSPGGKVVMFETGQFSELWRGLAERLGLIVEMIDGDWRHGADAAKLEQILSKDKGHKIKAVCVVHNDTSTGITSNISAIRNALNKSGHPALLMVDSVSSLASIDYRHDEWGVDVGICGSQKGLMLPPGLSFNAISDKALEAAKKSTMVKSYWAWQPMLDANENGFFPHTPATNLLYGLAEALKMLGMEGLENVFARHSRLAGATRAAVKAWGFETQSVVEAEFSNSLTCVRLPHGHSADNFRKIVLDKFNMSLGNGLGRLNDKVFRIGHLGAINDLMLTGSLSGVEMGLKIAAIPYNKGGVDAAIEYLGDTLP